jgi:hypothetical protein
VSPQFSGRSPARIAGQGGKPRRSEPSRQHPRQRLGRRDKCSRSPMRTQSGRDLHPRSSILGFCNARSRDPTSEDLARDTTGRPAARLPASTRTRSSGRPPCAPSRARGSAHRAGKIMTGLTDGRADHDSDGCPGSGHPVELEISSITACATVRPSGRRACWTDAPSLLEVRAKTKTPPLCTRAASNIGASEPTRGRESP